ncbi:MAG: helix-turn-helix domain-containing protein [Prevotellaceae bacterium]|jgi:AraC-like DNA-binding protein|nr:helix-turn-helix domain-containing protein [Prevotellaceae bacterium]
MKVQNEKFIKVIVDDLYQYSGFSVIKNFIVSDKNLKYPNSPAQFEYPYIFEGMTFAICIRGRGRIKINLVEYEIDSNCIITILPNTVLEFLEKDDNSLAEFLIFSPEFISDLCLPPNIDFVEKVESMPCLQISEEECKNLLDFHSFIVKQYKRADNEYRVEIVKTLLLAMLIEIFSIYKMPHNHQPKVLTHKARLLSTLIHLLNKHHQQERSISFYADKMCLTPKYLSKVIKEISGKSILTWINESVINTAKALLKSSNMTVLQISEELNFPNPSFFGRYFKQHTGLTPKDYRDRH